MQNASERSRPYATDSAQPRFAQLTPDERIWRVDWFGHCAYPGSVERYAQPCLRVALTPMKAESISCLSLGLGDLTELSEVHEAWVPVGALPMLAIGDLWKNGVRVESPDYQVETFRALNIQRQSVMFIKAGLAIDEHYLLPLRRHPWHRPFTQSYAVLVPLADGRRLLIPCVELIRFYFGSSANLLTRLFKAPFAEGCFWTKLKFNPKRRHLHLVLAERMSMASVEDLGRIALSAVAKHAASGIHASCLVAASQGQPTYPRIGFPFEGRTDLEANGMWLPFADQQNATFVVFRLRSCAHPFPFQSLSYTAPDRKVTYAKGASSSDEKQKAARAQKERATEMKNVDPGRQKVQRSAPFTSRHRFPDLVGKPVWREAIEAMPKPDVYLRSAEGGMAQISVGEPENSSAVAGVDVQRVQDDASTQAVAPKIPWFVRIGLERIAAEFPTEASIKIVCPEGRMEPVFSLPSIIDQDGVIDERMLHKGNDGAMRQRRGCFAEIAGERVESQYRLIVEGKQGGVKPEVSLVERPALLPGLWG